MNKIIFLIAVCLLKQAAIAQTDTLTLAKAIETALVNNGNIKIAQREVVKNEYSLKETKTNLFPTIYGTAHYLFAPINLYSETVTNGGEYGLQVSTSYTIYDGDKNNDQINKATLNINKAELSTQKTKSDLKYDIRSIYIEINRLKSECNIRQKSDSIFTEYISLLKQLKLSGIASEGDILKAEVEFNNNNILFSTLKQNIIKLKYALNNIIGVKIDKQFEVTEPNEIDSLNNESNPIDNITDIKLTQKEIELSNYDIQIAKKEKLPTVNLNGDFGFLGIYPKEYLHNAGFSAAISLSIPLFDWGAIDSRINQSEISRAQNEIKLDVQKRELNTAILSFQNDINLAKENIVKYSSNISLAINNYNNAKLRFKGGVGSNLEVLDAHQLIVESEINFNNAIAQLRSAKFNLLKIYGN